MHLLRVSVLRTISRLGFRCWLCWRVEKNPEKLPKTPEKTSKTPEKLAEKRTSLRETPENATATENYFRRFFFVPNFAVRKRFWKI